MRLRTSLVVSMALAFAPFSNAANASCKAPEPKLVWSSPADGATDVPTNAAIWLLLANWYRPPEILLNGAPVPVAEIPFLYRPAALEPRTRYEVKVTATPVGSQTVVEVTWGFTTGEGPSSLEAPAPPEIDLRFGDAESRARRALHGSLVRLLRHRPEHTCDVPRRWSRTARVGSGTRARSAASGRVVRVPPVAGHLRYAGDLHDRSRDERLLPFLSGTRRRRYGPNRGKSVVLSIVVVRSAPGSGCAIADPRSPHGGACLPFVIWVLVSLFTRRPTRRERTSANHLRAASSRRSPSCR